MGVPLSAGWRAMASRGFADLSPPEAVHAFLELPTNRADYVGVLQDIGDYPIRSPIGDRVPTDDEVRALKRSAGRWRAVVLLEDERALRAAACVFSRLFVLDPFYDTGALLYAAWHDLMLKDEQSRRLAEQAGMLVRAAPLLNAGTAVLAPDHLPGSWNPRPGWRKPGLTQDPRQLAGWTVRTGLVLVYWADRLDALVCTTRPDVIAGLDVVLGPRAATCSVGIHEPQRIDDAQMERHSSAEHLCHCWREVRRVSRRRARARLHDVAYEMASVAEQIRRTQPSGEWRLSLGETSVPEPAMLIRRVLNGQDPERDPPLPRKKLKRRPLCLMPASS